MSRNANSIAQTGTGRAVQSYPGNGGASIQCVLSGTATYTIQWSNDGGVTWVDHETLAAATASASGSFVVPVETYAVYITSGSGTVTAYVHGVAL